MSRSVFLRHTPETLGIMGKIREMTDIRDISLLFEAAERVIKNDPALISPALLKKRMPISNADSPSTSTLRFIVSDEVLNDEVEEIIKKALGLKKIQTKILFKLVFLAYISYLQEQPEKAKTTEREEKEEKNMEGILAIKLKLIEEIINQNDLETLTDLLGYYEYRLK